MSKKPLVSFCIASYRRPHFLKSTIDSILTQSYKNIEIIVSEDYSEENAKEIIKKYRTKRIKYILNKRKLGMTKSYNVAIKSANGEFITLLADDDPPTKDMLKTFIKALNMYPQAQAFFGGSYAKITTSKIEKVTKLRVGLNSMVNKTEDYGSVRILTSKDFIKSFLKQEIFPHYQWTAAVISNNIINKIGGVPDYNSAHFIDYAYLIKAAFLTDFVIINKEMSIFTLHESSYGKKGDFEKEYIRGIIGFDHTIKKIINHYNLSDEYQKFIVDYVLMFLLNRLSHYNAHQIKIKSMDLFRFYRKIGKKINFFNKRQLEVFLKLNLDRVPKPKLINYIYEKVI